jgi:beta-galactosidase
MKPYSAHFALLLATLLIHPATAQHTNNPTTITEKLSLDNGWRFHLGDIPFPVIKGHDNSYNNAKAGNASGAASPTYNDKTWRILDVPHDWVIEQPFDSTANLSQGYRHRGFGWYRRHFKLAENDRGKNIELQFDGIATHATIWFNGILVHRNFCGYTSSYIDVTAFVKYGNEVNTIAVRVDAEQQEGWWYEGGGIYRHTWLVKRSPVHIITDGVFAHPVLTKGNDWQIPAQVTLRNTGLSDADDVEIEIGLYDRNGKMVVSKTTSTKVAVLSESTAFVSLPVTNPVVWSVDNPILYTVKTIVKHDKKIVDAVTTKCGFRTIRFDAVSGFYLNNQYLKIKGVCNHQDHAGVGVAVPDALWAFRLKKLKEIGANAYRCAHNPPAKEFLDACDSLGIIVMDENRIFNSTPEYIRQLQWMVRRDRNHPSVILWSVFNEEVPVQGSAIGYEMVRRMNAEVKKMDTTRMVTAAMNGGLFEPVNVSQAVDVVGFNYFPESYDTFHKTNPKFPATSSEDGSTFMIRGQYVTDKNKNLLDAYDTQIPSWGATHRNSWKAIDERRFIAGCFVWTGFDYHGEPAPFKWPTVSSNFGILDICGFPKTAFYIRQAQWLPKSKPVLQIVPHWNWPIDSIGKAMKVFVASNAESVKLFLNGKLIGTKKVDKYDMVDWSVPYKPGKLKAVAYSGGKETAQCVVETTGKAVSIELVADRTSISGDGRDAVPVTVRVLDAEGRAVPTAQDMIEFEVSGPGTIIGLGNGNPNSHEPEKARLPDGQGNKRSLFNGLAQVILQSKAGSQGNLVLTAKSGSLKIGTTVIVVRRITHSLAVGVEE